MQEIIKIYLYTGITLGIMVILYSILYYYYNKWAIRYEPALGSALRRYRVCKESRKGVCIGILLCVPLVNILVLWLLIDN